MRKQIKNILLGLLTVILVASAAYFANTAHAVECTGAGVSIGNNGDGTFSATFSISGDTEFFLQAGVATSGGLQVTGVSMGNGSTIASSSPASGFTVTITGNIVGEGDQWISVNGIKMGSADGSANATPGDVSSGFHVKTQAEREQEASIAASIAESQAEVDRYNASVAEEERIKQESIAASKAVIDNSIAAEQSSIQASIAEIESKEASSLAEILESEEASRKASLAEEEEKESIRQSIEESESLSAYRSSVDESMIELTRAYVIDGTYFIPFNYNKHLADDFLFATADTPVDLPEGYRLVQLIVNRQDAWAAKNSSMGKNLFLVYGKTDIDSEAAYYFFDVVNDAVFPYNAITGEKLVNEAKPEPAPVPQTTRKLDTVVVVVIAVIAFLLGAILSAILFILLKMKNTTPDDNGPDEVKVVPEARAEEASEDIVEDSSEEVIEADIESAIAEEVEKALNVSVENTENDENLDQMMDQLFDESLPVQETEVIE